ncbi:MAG: dTDP-4-dehydrorhamnose 3,5-epimerase [Candidatus Eremiobacteraeota bacterium]|nr:dTDP-4-dehydrorhamnose 3,5-epimerase [Candidatus Eremiobacteraeota bacterium]
MEVEELPLTGALLLRPQTFADERGYFKETYSTQRYHACGITESFVQDNISLSHCDVLRGLHGDRRMAKLVSVLRGSVFDVIVDVRGASPTYGRWWGATLTATGGHQVYVPRHFLHGYLALEDETIFAYKQSAAYDPACEIAIAWNDAEVGIDWPLNGRRPILSRRDAANPTLASLRPA